MPEFVTSEPYGETDYCPQLPSEHDARMGAVVDDVARLIDLGGAMQEDIQVRAEVGRRCRHLLQPHGLVTDPRGEVRRPAIQERQVDVHQVRSAGLMSALKGNVVGPPPGATCVYDVDCVAMSSKKAPLISKFAHHRFSR